MARTHGSYAEYTAVTPAATMEPLARIPDGVADDQAAALPIPAVTALRTVDLLEVTAGQHVVVMGATGGVGGYAVQMARSRGAHVIAARTTPSITRAYVGRECVHGLTRAGYGRWPIALQEPGCAGGSPWCSAARLS